MVFVGQEEIHLQNSSTVFVYFSLIVLWTVWHTWSLLKYAVETKIKVPPVSGAVILLCLEIAAYHHNVVNLWL